MCLSYTGYVLRCTELRDPYYSYVRNQNGLFPFAQLIPKNWGGTGRNMIGGDTECTIMRHLNQRKVVTLVVNFSVVTLEDVKTRVEGIFGSTPFEEESVVFFVILCLVKWFNLNTIQSWSCMIRQHACGRQGIFFFFTWHLFFGKETQVINTNQTFLLQTHRLHLVEATWFRARHLCLVWFQKMIHTKFTLPDSNRPSLPQKEARSSPNRSLTTKSPNHHPRLIVAINLSLESCSTMVSGAMPASFQGRKIWIYKNRFQVAVFHSLSYLERLILRSKPW